MLPEPVRAGLLLRVQRIPVLGRAAFDDVGDVDVLLPVQIDDLQHLVQQLSAPAHKGLSLEILVLSRTLADEHDLRVLFPHAEHHVCPRLVQGAFPALQTRFFKLLPIHTRDLLFAFALIPYHTRYGGKSPASAGEVSGEKS